MVVKRRTWLTGCLLMVIPAGIQLALRTVFAAAGPAPPAVEPPEAQFLPLFPLGIVAFPGEFVPLRIFEPRYRQLITECVETRINFGIVTVVPGGASSIGTEMTVDSILKTYPTGDMDVITLGIRTFELKSIQSVVQGKLYSGGLVRFNKNDPRIDPETQNTLVEMYNRLQSLAGSTRKISAPFPENLSFAIGHDVGLSQAQELQLLTIPVEHDRQLYLLRHLGKSI